MRVGRKAVGWWPCQLETVQDIMRCFMTRKYDSNYSRSLAHFLEATKVIGLLRNNQGEAESTEYTRDV